jgi:hypothetical protein
VHKYDTVTNTDNTFDWLHNGKKNRTPTAARFSSDSSDNEFVPVNNDATPFQETNGQQNF